MANVYQDVDLLRLDDGLYDIQIDADGDIKTKDSFDADIITSLFSDKRADSSEVTIPFHRRGWIGNELNDDGFELGSKLWLFQQERLTQTTLNALATEAQNCLQWLVRDGFAKSVTAVASRSNGTAVLTITLKTASEALTQTFTMWQNTTGSSS